MKHLLQRMYAFLLHVQDAPETAPETREAAEELERDVVDLMHGNYVEPDEESDNEDNENRPNRLGGIVGDLIAALILFGLFVLAYGWPEFPSDREQQEQAAQHAVK